ncbi:DNA-binding response regulator [Caballeronia arationis]|uniref:response regulator n=1 Tax=Caballeronia arationis TaxID=1777142 RepID=UPI00074D1382|nr:response regulator [Caballeronia arationis]SAL06936.1 DNA-binding response regulator [Caballeronia arationis]
MRLLLVEGDVMIADTMLESMRRAGYAIDWAEDGRTAELSLRNSAYDLVLLDLDPPKGDGIDVLSRYRQAGGAAAVIILTARDTGDDRSRGLDVGADDYLVKPFELDEFVARVRTLLRRRAGPTQSVFEHGELRLDAAAQKATKNGEILALLPREFALLQTLIEEPTRVFLRADLEKKLYGSFDDEASTVIEGDVHGLQRKVGAEQIVTIRGVGYRLMSLG